MPRLSSIVVPVHKKQLLTLFFLPDEGENSPLKRTEFATEEQLKEQNSPMQERNLPLKKQNSPLKEQNASLREQNASLREQNLALKEQNWPLKERLWCYDYGFMSRNVTIFLDALHGLNVNIFYEYLSNMRLRNNIVIKHLQRHH
ncbi:hypothetical protein Tcan_12513 [Toxocara canis]|uniref:Uncharacterized protein n=1 Tax=Toxocara canis TaxID=6265 RepID=A0A0B2V3S9_TOXCA|nr:hypothetical protein Tcan_12513 [Toxocara canis]